MLFRSYNSPTYVGGQTYGNTGTTSSITINFSLSGGISSTPAVGDLVIVAFSTASASDRDLRISPNGGTSYPYIELADLYANKTQDTNLGVYYKKLVSSADTGIILPDGTFATSDAGTVAIQVWRNATLDANLVSTSSTTTAIPNPPSITTYTNNAVVIAIGASAHTQNQNTFTASQLSNFLTIGINSTNDSTLGMGSYVQTTAGAFDPAAWTFGGTDSTNFSYVAATLALKNPTPNTVSANAAVTLGNSWPNGSTVYLYNNTSVSIVGGTGFPGDPGIGGTGGTGGTWAAGSPGSSGGNAGNGYPGGYGINLTRSNNVIVAVKNLGTISGGTGGAASALIGGGGGGGGQGQ